MDATNTYPALVIRLNRCGFIVITSGTGYFVQNVNVLDDQSAVHTLSDLIIFTARLEGSSQHALAGSAARTRMR